MRPAQLARGSRLTAFASPFAGMPFRRRAGHVTVCRGLRHGPRHPWEALMSTNGKTATDGKLRIAVADDEPDVRDYFCTFLPALGYEVVAVARTGKELVQQCRETEPDLLITDVRMPDMDGIEAAGLVCRDRPLPVILVTAYPEPELLDRPGAECVFGYLVKPIKRADLHPTITLAVRRFEHATSLYREAADLRQAVEDRKTVERAKGIVMRRLGVDEQEAYRRINHVSRNKNWKLIDLSRHILRSDQVFEELERAGPGRREVARGPTVTAPPATTSRPDTPGTDA
jgi:response regulator NasT